VGSRKPVARGLCHIELSMALAAGARWRLGRGFANDQRAAEGQEQAALYYVGLRMIERFDALRNRIEVCECHNIAL